MKLLNQLCDSDVASKTKIAWFIGANKFEEHESLSLNFPNLQKVYLFDPSPKANSFLSQKFINDKRITVFPFAVSDYDGRADFFIANNDVSSSLLPLGKHKDIFPDVCFVETIQVEVRKLETILRDNQLEPPEMIFIDAQGSELRILSCLSNDILANTFVIIAEASTEELYETSGNLDDLKTLLCDHFDYIDFVPLDGCLSHGDALFVNKKFLFKS